MWVFAYGALMWDTWEQQFLGVRTDGATLKDFRRDFNEASIVHWGTPKSPGATLGLVKEANAECAGSAFEFGDGHRAAIRSYLRQREGPSFSFPELPVNLPDGRTISAITAINDADAPTYLGAVALQQRAALACRAAGGAGRCVDYVLRVRDKLGQLSISDPSVEEFWEAVQPRNRSARRSR